MGRKKRSNGNAQVGVQEPKRVKLETGETYPVKKYRADKMYPSMEAFVRYTKAHRMLDASYVRWSMGATPDKPFVFSTRVGGTDLGWGRGKTRDAALDCACRAAFALVNAHGYKNFPIDEDCMAEMPVDVYVPPPPPPPPPDAAPPLPPGAPPLPPPPVDLIPQAPVVQAESAPVATKLATPLNSSTKTSEPTKVTMTLGPQPQRKQIKGGLTLVFDAGAEGVDEMSMEEMRASLPRYQKMLKR